MDEVNAQDAVDDDPTVVFRPQPKTTEPVDAMTDNNTDEPSTHVEDDDKVEELDDINDDLFEGLKPKKSNVQPVDSQTAHKLADETPVEKPKKKKRKIQQETDSSVEETDPYEPYDQDEPLPKRQLQGYGREDDELDRDKKIVKLRAKLQVRQAANTKCLRDDLLLTDDQLFKDLELDPNTGLYNVNRLSYEELLEKRADIKTGFAIYRQVGGIQRQYKLLSNLIDAVAKNIFGFEGVTGVQNMFQKHVALHTYEELGKVNPFVSYKPTALDRLLELAEPSVEALTALYRGAKEQQRIKKVASRHLSPTALEHYRKMLN